MEFLSSQDSEKTFDSEQKCLLNQPILASPASEGDEHGDETMNIQINRIKII